MSLQCYEKYIARHGVEIRPKEVEDLRSLTEQLRGAECGGAMFDGYHVGYRIPQIGKEFDLLRFGANYHISLELKADCEVEKMRQQLCRNKYYLGYLGKECFFVSYSSLTRQFFALTIDDRLVEVDAGEIRRLLSSQVLADNIPIDDRFNPSGYLVSPFNSPGKFILGKYFLTSQQEDVRCQVLKLLGGSAPSVFISLTGAAGTGKTLLAYDIIGELTRSGGAPLIIHCGKLNNGHYSLIGAGWRIISIKGMGRVDLGAYSAILLDEAQRVRPEQFAEIVNKISVSGGRCIFSYDHSQTLADYEAKYDIAGLISVIPGVSKFSLSEKIRKNREISRFIKSFFNATRGLKIPDTGNIELVYFGHSDDAIQHLASLSGAEWKVIKFTPSQYRHEHHETYSSQISSTSHDVIGQEFDGVAVMVDQYFSYNDHGALIYTGSTYYQPVKMLFQNMTRARRRLRLIIINNPKMLDACMDIFQ